MFFRFLENITTRRRQQQEKLAEKALEEARKKQLAETVPTTGLTTSATMPALAVSSSGFLEGIFALIWLFYHLRLAKCQHYHYYHFTSLDLMDYLLTLKV